MSDSEVGDYELGVEGARYNAFIWKQSVFFALALIGGPA